MPTEAPMFCPREPVARIILVPYLPAIHPTDDLHDGCPPSVS